MPIWLTITMTALGAAAPYIAPVVTPVLQHLPIWASSLLQGLVSAGVAAYGAIYHLNVPTISQPTVTKQ